jgi:hypothetical protein
LSVTSHRGSRFPGAEHFVIDHTYLLNPGQLDNTVPFVRVQDIQAIAGVLVDAEAICSSDQKADFRT